MSTQALQGTVAEPLTAEDRCDRCGAQAYLRAILPGGADLLFCAHHAEEHNDHIVKTAAYIHDERDRLLQ